jgi:hypothetical protein
MVVFHSYVSLPEGIISWSMLVQSLQTGKRISAPNVRQQEARPQAHSAFHGVHLGHFGNPGRFPRKMIEINVVNIECLL